MDALWTLLVVAGYGLAGLAALVAVLVIVPVDVRARGTLAEDDVDGAAVVRWGYFLVAVRATPRGGVALTLLGLRVWRFSLEKSDADKEKKAQEKDAQTEKKKAKRAKKKAKRAKKKAAGKETSFLPWIRAHRRWLVETITRTVGVFHVRLRVSGVLGLDDPADTFVLFELLDQIGRLPGVELWLERDYLDDTLDLEAELGARLWLLELLAVAAVHLLKTETWRALRAMP